MQDNPCNVVLLRSAARDRAEERALAVVVDLARETQVALNEVVIGDVDWIWTAHRALNRAMGLVLDHHLATAWNWRPRA